MVMASKENGGGDCKEERDWEEIETVVKGDCVYGKLRGSGGGIFRSSSVDGSDGGGA